MKRWLGLSGYAAGGLGWLPVAVVAALLSAPHALAQSGELRSLLDRMERLERDIGALNRQLSRGGKRPLVAPGAVSGTADAGPAIARLDIRLTALDEELRAATGKMEELTHRIGQINSRLDKLVGDVDYRLSILEGTRTGAPGVAEAPVSGPPRTAAVPRAPAVEARAPGARGQGFAAPPGILGTITENDLKAITPPKARAGPAQPAVAPAATETAVLPEGTPKERYTYAFGLLRQAKYDEAEAALRAFIQAHGDDPLASNARFWLGDTYYVREQFKEAAKTFLAGYKADPKGAKAPDDLLKLGMSLARLEKKKEACVTFAKLKTDFPDAPDRIKKAAARERQRAACK
jgi:tol-pal system protein YbgF